MVRQLQPGAPWIPQPLPPLFCLHVCMPGGSMFGTGWCALPLFEAGMQPVAGQVSPGQPHDCRGAFAELWTRLPWPCRWHLPCSQQAAFMAYILSMPKLCMWHQSRSGAAMASSCAVVLCNGDAHDLEHVPGSLPQAAETAAAAAGTRVLQVLAIAYDHGNARVLIA